MSTLNRKLATCLFLIGVIGAVACTETSVVLPPEQIVSPPPTPTIAQDTDGDGLSDEEEMTIGTSIDLADTDGDGQSDKTEVTSGGFNPLIADLPAVTIDVIDAPSIQIDTVFTEEQRQDQMFSATYEQGQESSFSRSNTEATSSTSERSDTISTEVSVQASLTSFGGSASVGTESSVSEAVTNEVSTTTTAASAKSSRQEYGRYEAATTNQSIKSESGSITASLKISNTSNVTFDLATVEVIAKKRIANSNRFEPLGTLVFQASDDGSPVPMGNGASIEKLVVTKTKNVAVLRELMRNPSGLLFTVGNYRMQKIANEEGRDFARLSQDIAAQTAHVVIDYGDNQLANGRSVESYMVATNVDRDPVTREVLGITVDKALQNILEIPYQTSDQEILDANNNPTGGTRKVLSAVRDQASQSIESGFWYVFSSSASVNDPNVNFDEIVLLPRDRITLVYLADSDRDGLFNREEFLLGTDIDVDDTDGDTLDDKLEAKTGWVVPINGGYRVFSDPLTFDADRDGSNDAEEFARETDPFKADTDEDGIKDPLDMEPFGGVAGASFALNFTGPGNNISVDGSVSASSTIERIEFDWGDSSGVAVVQGGFSDISLTHTYAAKMDYTINVTAYSTDAQPVAQVYDVKFEQRFDSANVGLTAADGWTEMMHTRLAMDINGDDQVDLIGFDATGTFVALSNGTGFSTAAEVAALRGAFVARDYDKADHLITLANVGGSPLPDIVFFADTGVQVAINNGGGTFSAPTEWIADYGFNDGYTVAKNPRYLSRIDSDDQMDLVVFADDGVYVALSSGTGFQDVGLVRSGFGANNGYTVNHPRVMADVDGDSFPDIVAFAQAESIVAVGRYDDVDDNGVALGFSTARLSTPSFRTGVGYNASRHIRTALDLTGDNRADLVAFANAGVFAERATNAGFSGSFYSVSTQFGYDDGFRLGEHPRHFADINGDGFLDIVGFAPAPFDTVIYALNTGINGDFNTWREWHGLGDDFSTGWTADENPRLMGDVNGDGRDDIIGFDDDSIVVEFSVQVE